MLDRIKSAARGAHAAANTMIQVMANAMTVETMRLALRSMQADHVKLQQLYAERGAELEAVRFSRGSEHVELIAMSKRLESINDELEAARAELADNHQDAQRTQSTLVAQMTKIESLTNERDALRSERDAARLASENATRQCMTRISNADERVAEYREDYETEKANKEHFREIAERLQKRIDELTASSTRLSENHQGLRAELDQCVRHRNAAIASRDQAVADRHTISMYIDSTRAILVATESETVIDAALRHANGARRLAALDAAIERMTPEARSRLLACIALDFPVASVDAIGNIEFATIKENPHV